MHLAYRLYNALASLHLLIGSLLLISGFYGSFRYVSTEEQSNREREGPFFEPISSSWHTKKEVNTTTWVVSLQGFTLSGPYFISCISAALYSTVYLSLFMHSSTDKEDNQLWSKISYYQTEPAQHEDQDALEQWANLMIISEIVFWSFLLSYSYVAMASNTLILNSLDFLFLRIVVHLFCIYIICSPAQHKTKRVDIASSLAFVGFVAETFIVIVSARSQINIVMGYFHRFLDLLLILGHRWDHNPSWEVIMNCRLFVVAVGGALLHVDMMISSQKD